MTGGGDRVRAEKVGNPQECVLPNLGDVVPLSSVDQFLLWDMPRFRMRQAAEDHAVLRPASTR
jgi:hypothetical protein